MYLVTAHCDHMTRPRQIEHTLCVAGETRMLQILVVVAIIGLLCGRSEADVELLHPKQVAGLTKVSMDVRSSLSSRHGRCNALASALGARLSP